jgi:hypothetical protein
MTAPSIDPYLYRMLRPVAGLGVASTILIAITTALGIVSAWSTWNAYFLAERFLDDDPTVGVSDLLAADDLVASIVWIRIALLVVTGVVFLFWLYRARLNSETICEVAHQRSRGWVVGSWICPIVNLWFPYQVVSDVWKASNPDTPRQIEILKTERMGSLRFVSGSAQLGFWWACWAASFVIDRVAAKVIYDADDPTKEMFRAVAIAETLVMVLIAVSGVLIIMVMRQITRWQSPPQGMS